MTVGVESESRPACKNPPPLTLLHREGRGGHLSTEGGRRKEAQNLPSINTSSHLQVPPEYHLCGKRDFS